jgi:hypothetical protein
MAQKGAALQTYNLEIVKGGCVKAIRLPFAETAP